jgi:hypothetical protein
VAYPSRLFTSLEQTVNDYKYTNTQEHRIAKMQSQALSESYSSVSAGLKLSVAFLRHLVSLIKNAILLTVVFTACVLTVIPFLNPTLAEVDDGKDVTLSAMLRTLAFEQLKLALTNTFNMVIAAISPVVRSIRSVGGLEKNGMTDHNLVQDTWGSNYSYN